MRGTIGDEAIEVRSVLFAEHPESLGDDGLIFVVMSELPHACSPYSYWFAESSGLTTPDDLAASWSSTFPESFWEVLVVLRVADPAAPVPLQTFQGLEWFELLELPSRFFVRFTKNVAHRDAAWWDGTGASEDYVEEYLSHQGELRVKHHEPGVRFHGRIDTLVVDTETTEAQGVVELRFDADLCAGVLGL